MTPRLARAGVLRLAFAFVAACTAPATPQQGAPGSVPSQIAPSGVPAQVPAASGPLDVSVTLHQAAASSREIGPDGGSLTATASDGTRLTLEIPRGALSAAQLITMTPVTGISPFPFSKGLAGAVQLEPEGLQLATPALLTIEPTTPVPPLEREGFSYYGAGNDLHMYPLERDRDRLTLRLGHFSGGGVGKATDADRRAQAGRTPRSTEAQLWQRVAELLAHERAKQLLGTADERASAEAQRLLMDAVNATIARALQECDAASLLAVERAAQLMGVSWVTDAQAKEFDEKCNAVWLSFETTITGRRMVGNHVDREHVLRAKTENARARSDGKGDLVGTALVAATYTVTQYASDGTVHCSNDAGGTILLSFRIVGGTTSPSPTLLLSFQQYSENVSCRSDLRDADVGAVVYFLWSLHDDEIVDSSDTVLGSWRVVGWTHAGDSQLRSWRKTYTRELTEGVAADPMPVNERTVIELRRTPAK